MVVVFGVVCGIVYLYYECRLSIIYCDVKLENIFLSGDFIFKVVDFGLVKFMGKDVS